MRERIHFHSEHHLFCRIFSRHFVTSFSFMCVCVQFLFLLLFVFSTYFNEIFISSQLFYVFIKIKYQNLLVLELVVDGWPVLRKENQKCSLDFENEVFRIDHFKSEQQKTVLSDCKIQLCDWKHKINSKNSSA